ncbi:unnamed protein product, partial [marine sediment metagenome]
SDNPSSRIGQIILKRIYLKYTPHNKNESYSIKIYFTLIINVFYRELEKFLRTDQIF